MRLVRDSSLSVVLKIGRFALGIGSAVLLTRLMPIHDYGLYALALSIALLLAIPGESGMPTLATREMSQARIDDDRPRMRGFMVFANASVLLLSVGVAIIVVLMMLWLGDRISRELMLLLAIAFPALVLGSLANTRAGILRALGNPVLSQVPEQLVRPAGLILVVWILFVAAQRPLTAFDAMTAYLISSAAAFLFGSALLYAAWRREIGSGPAAYRTRPWLKALVPFSAISGLQYALALISTVLLGIYAPPSEVALFRIAWLAAEIAIFSVFAINAVIAPEIARHFHRGEAAKVEMLISRANRLNVVYSLIVAGALVVAGPFALGAGFGAEYRNAYLPMCVLACGHVGSTTVGYVATLANMAGRERLTVGGSILGVTLNAVLALLLCARYGALGAAIATSVAAVTWRIALALRLRTAIGIRTWAFKWTLDRTDLSQLKL